MFGRGGSGPSRRARSWAAGAALVLAVGLTLAPPAAAPAAAATGRLLVTSAATYVVDPAGGAVHVTDVVTLRNDKPSSANYYYYWRDLAWNVHPDATAIAIRDGSGALAVTPRARDGYIEAEFRLRRNLLYRQSVTLTITWDLPGGAPRSTSSIRVGDAFATFDVWAWGDNGKSSVTVKLPAGFEASTFGTQLDEAASADGVTLTATAIATPYDFWSAVVAVRDDAMATDELTLPAGIDVVVRGWPEDTIWRTTVLNTLRPGLPELQELIGLPWPVEKELEVTEVFSPLLEGYAGIYYVDDQRIEVSEELDAHTILHEAAHAWFNSDLFDERWIGEGLANTYAAAVLVEMGEDEVLPEKPRSSDEGEVDLSEWRFPGRVDDETVATETYGYNAAWYVVNELYEEIGDARFRAVLAAAEADQIAYQGAGDPELVGGTSNWRRFLDLLEEIGGSKEAEELFRTYVTTSSMDHQLDARADARDAYADLVAAGDGWLPPIYIRGLLANWGFRTLEPRLEEAHEILELRDDVAAAAAELELQPGDALETAYEAARDGFQKAEAAARAELDALEALAEADAAVDAQPDFVATIGLIGETPAATYEEATAAYEAGDLAGAEEAAAAAMVVIEAAPKIGGERLTTAGGIAAGVALLVLFAVLLLRRRRRRLRIAAAAGGASDGASDAASGGAIAAAVALEPASPGGVATPTGEVSSIGAYGTLAADSPAAASGADPAGEGDGGTADGEGSSAAP